MLSPKSDFACHKRHVRDERAQQVLSSHQASVLDHLDDVEATALFDLARHMGVTASTMSLAIDRLERSGYVLRERSTVDRRRVDLRLTAAGVRIKKQQKVLEPELVAAVLGAPGRAQAARGAARSRTFRGGKPRNDRLGRSESFFERGAA